MRPVVSSQKVFHITSRQPTSIYYFAQPLIQQCKRAVGLIYGKNGGVIQGMTTRMVMSIHAYMYFYVGFMSGADQED